MEDVFVFTGGEDRDICCLLDGSLRIDDVGIGGGTCGCWVGIVLLRCGGFAGVYEIESRGRGVWSKLGSLVLEERLGRGKGSVKVWG